MTYLQQLGGINCSGKQRWGQGEEADQHPHCLGRQNMRRIRQLLTLCDRWGRKSDFEMSEFQRLGVSLPQSAFWKGDWVSRSSSKEQGQDAVKGSMGRKVAEDKSQGRHRAPRGGEESSFCGLRCCSVMDSLPTMPSTRMQPWRRQITPKHNWGGD